MLPVFSKPYNDLFCSSSSCCLLCLHTKHLKDKDISTLPVVRARSADKGPRQFSCNSKLGVRRLANDVAFTCQFEFSKLVLCNNYTCPRVLL